MSERTFITSSARETYLLGQKLGSHLEAGDIVALTGELGAGKTCFTQGLARGIGIPEECAITSPTFTLINEYRGRVVLYHMDMYRLSGLKDLDDIGYDDCLDGRGVVVVEWAEKIRALLPEDAIYLTFLYLDEERRRIVISCTMDRMPLILGALGRQVPG